LTNQVPCWLRSTAVLGTDHCDSCLHVRNWYVCTPSRSPPVPARSLTRSLVRSFRCDPCDLVDSLCGSDLRHVPCSWSWPLTTLQPPHLCASRFSTALFPSLLLAWKSRDSVTHLFREATHSCRSSIHIKLNYSFNQSIYGSERSVVIAWE